MKVRLVAIFFLFSIVGVERADAQSYNMSNTPVTVSCGSTIQFYDPGGPNSNYSNNQNFTQTFTASDSTKCLQVTFTSFSLESHTSCSWDYLEIYSGSSTSDVLLGEFCGNNSPGTLTSNTGAITFKFHSDVSANYQGWVATISCVDCGGSGGGGTGGVIPDCVSSDQGSPCFPGNIHPFCTDENPYGITYHPGTTGSASQFLGYRPACLSSTPAPAWYYMQIDVGGNLIFNISATLDVDFACWGPFQATSQQDFVNKLCCGVYQLHTADHPNNTSSSANYPYGNLVDCSYSLAHTETCHIYNTQVGEWYLLLLTNYSQTNGTITFSSSSSSTATTNCELLVPFTYNGPLCEGDDLVLTCTNPITGVTYHWSGPGGWTDSTSTPTVTRPNATASFTGEYSLYLTGSNISSQTSHITVTVGAMPDVQLTASSDTICRGSSVTLTASGASSYAWTPSGSTAAHRTFTPTVTTNYKVVGSNNSCHDTAYYTIVVNPLPEVAITTNPSNANICQGDTAVLFTASIGNHEWKIANTTTVVGNEDTLRVSPASNTSYRVIVTNEHGCTNSATKTVVVRNLPSVSISGDSEICLGDSTQLTSSTATTYLWNTGQITQTIYAKPAVDSTYSVIVTNAYGCSSTSSKNIHVYQALSTNTADSACLSYTWHGTEYTQTGTYLYEHSNELGCIQVDTLQLQIFNLHHQSSVVQTCEPYSWNGTIYSTSGTYTYTHLTSENCTQVDTLKLTVTEKPQIVALEVSDAICGEDNGKLQVQINGGVSPIRMVYLPGNQNAVFDNLPGGDYHLKVIDSLTCFADTFFTIQAFPMPEACFNINHNSDNDYEIVLDNCTSGDVIEWSWTFGDGSVSDDWAPIHLYAEPGNYLVSLTVSDSHQCVDNEQTMYAINDILTFYLPSAFYPQSEIVENQSFGPRGISIAEEGYELYIYDRWGEKVFESHLPSQTWDGTFNGADAPAGEYIYRVIYRDLNRGWHTTKGKVLLLR